MHGLLLLDKFPGPTSHDVVDIARGVFGVRRAGHAGTLDPDASGLLLVLIGHATRTAEYFSGLDKEYLATVRLGVSTPTDDLASNPRETRPVPAVTAESLEPHLAPLRGLIEQRPPDFAAIKVGGRKLYELARAGRPVDAPRRRVTVHALACVAVRPQEIDLRVVCSAGTYIRALARDLGASLGCGGAVARLRRTRTGPFRVDDAVPLVALGRWHVPGALIPLDRALGHLPRAGVRPAALEKVRHGTWLAVDDLAEPVPEGVPDGSPCRICAGAEVLGVGIALGAGTPEAIVQPRKVFAPPPAKAPPPEAAVDLLQAESNDVL